MYVVGEYFRLPERVKQWVMTDWKGGPPHCSGLSPKTGVNSFDSHLILTHRPGSLFQKSNNQPNIQKTTKERHWLFQQPQYINTPTAISFSKVQPKTNNQVTNNKKFKKQQKTGVNSCNSHLISTHHQTTSQSKETAGLLQTKPQTGFHCQSLCYRVGL